MAEFRNEYDIEFYKQTAIAAMQGIQESGMKLSPVADIFVKETAKLAFNMADAMLGELHKRLDKEDAYSNIDCDADEEY